MTDSLRSSPMGLDDGGSHGYDGGYNYAGKLSGEETEDASESEFTMKKDDKDFTEIKEQMYQDKLTQLKKQLQQLEDRAFPEYLRRLRKIEQQYADRQYLNDTWKQLSLDNAERMYEAEKKQNRKDFELKKVDLKDSLISDWEEKKRKVENDKLHMELAADFLDFKPITTRKLRRRLNPDGNGGGNSGTQEKRRKQSPTINILLDEASINEDLKLINKVSGKPFTSRKPVQTASHDDHISPNDARIEDGKLYFEKRWRANSQQAANLAFAMNPDEALNAAGGWDDDEDTGWDW